MPELEKGPEATLAELAAIGQRLATEVWPFDDRIEFDQIRTLALRSPEDVEMRQRLRTPSTVRTEVRIYYGPPGTGKTLFAVRDAVVRADPLFKDTQDFVQVFKRFNELQEQIAFITFHQSLQYEDIVESIRPVLRDEEVPIASGQEPDSSDEGETELSENAANGSRLAYTKYEGPVLRLARRAIADPTREFAVVIDEINRGDISRILGPLISALEADKRAGAEFPIGFESLYPRAADVESRIFLPPNLHVIGTMNSADRNIALVDYALRRRFEFVECPPVEQMLVMTDGTPPIDVRQLLTALNTRIRFLLDRDHCIGHGYLMGCKTNLDVIERFALRVLPLLAEYFYSNEAALLLVLGEIGAKSPIFRVERGEEDFNALFRVDLAKAVDLGYRSQQMRLSLTVEPGFWNANRLIPGPDDEQYAVEALIKVYAGPGTGAGPVKTEPQTSGPETPPTAD